tara:strand:+ start:14244 stop:15794 length:1551 start_codon:yes stop_codon:yes gene_type:complete
MALWTPSNLGSGVLTAWYKADSITGSDGDAVTSWTDSSGNGNDVSQSVAVRQPTFQTDELNDLPVVRYDGTNDILTDGDIAELDVGTGDIWMATVLKSTDDSGVQDYFEKGHQEFGLSCLANGKLRICMGSTANGPVQDAGNWSRTEFVLVTGSRVSNTNNGFVNGSAMDTTGTTDNGSISNSNVLDIGSRAIGAGPMTGDIAEVLVGGATLTEDDRKRLEGYLAWKWGLEENLPSNHKYKKFPPTFTLPTVYWTAGGNPADVSDPDNWSDNAVPDANKKCVFNDKSSSITLGTLTAGEVRFSDGFSGDFGTSSAPLDITTDLLTINSPDASINIDCKSIGEIFIAGNGRGVHIEGTATDVFVESKDSLNLSLTSIQRLEVRHSSGAGGIIKTQSGTNTVVGYGGNVQGNNDLSGVKVYEGGYLFQNAGTDINGLQIFGGDVLFHGKEISRTTNKIYGGLLTILGSTSQELDLNAFSIYNGGRLDLSGAPIADFSGTITSFGGQIILGDGHSVAIA